jgi:hypothetical protein
MTDMTDMTDLGSRTARTMEKVTLAGVALALVMSGWALVTTLDDDDQERLVEQRLVCLELPGPNDCGADGR